MPYTDDEFQAMQNQRNQDYDRLTAELAAERAKIGHLRAIIADLIDETDPSGTSRRPALRAARRAIETNPAYVVKTMEPAEEESDEERQKREDAYNADDFARDYPNGEPPPCPAQEPTPSDAPR